MKPKWEHFEHQADIGIRGTGRTMAEAFEQAAVALTAVITPPERIFPGEAVRVHCEAPDRELLLVDWLSAILREMSALGMLFSRFEVTVSGNTLDAVLYGEPLDSERHEPVVEVKGATYFKLSVGQDQEGLWTAQCVVDV
jgi:tRNA nucleotidyltransferase (CCA-adding enzyme)